MNPREPGASTIKTAGALAFIAATQWVLLVIVAQSNYPHYNTNQNYLSDLGATCHVGVMVTPCVIVSPASFIWNATLALLGILSLASSVLFYQVCRKRGFSILFGIWGLGAAIAGFVPETLLSVHELASLAAFIGGSLAAIVAFRMLSTPIRYGSLALGIISLVCLVATTFDGPFYRWNGIFGLGLGGIERMVVYPIIVWEIAFGAYLMSGAADLAGGKAAPLITRLGSRRHDAGETGTRAESRVP